MAERIQKSIRNTEVDERLPPRVGLGAKRLLDIVLAACGLIGASPVMLLLAIAIRATMGSPILFRQTRPGLHGQPFVMLKFRSMDQARVASPALESEHGHDEVRMRVTRVGYWLRKTSLDELPELWNVLRGDMSIVGPRPLLTEYLPYYTSDQNRRHEMKPGVTGLAQIKGRHSLDWDDRFALDVRYVDHWSLRLDAHIMLATLKELLSMGGQGDYAAGSEPLPFDAYVRAKRQDGVPADE
jgi:lipopolysaccharide/colanic/teichoic acid biosynthesis glycosyltransferase